jgi:hypothetical protein
METKDNNHGGNAGKANASNNDQFPGYPVYPASDDIYNKEHKEADVDPEDTSKNKERADYGHRGMNEKNFNDDVSGGDLDVPGSELDDQEEDIGSEDEENNNYSIGGDNHDNLEEDNG